MTKQALAIEFRLAKESDAPALERLVQLAYRGGKASVDWKNEHDVVNGPRIRMEELNQLLSSQDKQVIIADIDGNMAGCVLVENHDGDAHIGMLSVHPDYQNYGLGRKLVSKAEEFGKSNFKCTTASMHVLSGRDELLRWYERLGYKLTGERVPFPIEDGGPKPIDDNAHFRTIAKTLG